MNLRRTPMPPPTKPLQRRTPLRAGRPPLRSALASTAQLARKAMPRKSKTRVGEFSPKTRRLLFALFDRRCAWCGDFLHPKAWTAQHRRARGAGGSRDPLTVSPANGAPVHQLPCHEYIESHPTEAQDRGFRIPQGADPREWPMQVWDGTWGYPTEDGRWIAVAADPEESA